MYCAAVRAARSESGARSTAAFASSIARALRPAAWAPLARTSRTSAVFPKGCARRSSSTKAPARSWLRVSARWIRASSSAGCGCRLELLAEQRIGLVELPARRVQHRDSLGGLVRARREFVPELRCLEAFRQCPALQGEFRSAPREAWIACLARELQVHGVRSADVAALRRHLGRHQLVQQRTGQVDVGNGVAVGRRVLGRRAPAAFAGAAPSPFPATGVAQPRIARVTAVANARVPIAGNDAR